VRGGSGRLSPQSLLSVPEHSGVGEATPSRRGRRGRRPCAGLWERTRRPRGPPLAQFGRVFQRGGRGWGFQAGASPRAARVFGPGTGASRDAGPAPEPFLQVRARAAADSAPKSRGPPSLIRGLLQRCAGRRTCAGCGAPQRPCCHRPGTQIGARPCLVLF
jgi:hypothetical protein